MAVLLRQDVRDVLLRHRVRNVATTVEARRSRVVLPRPPPEPLEPLEARHEHEHDADTRQVAEIGPEQHLVLDERLAGGEQAVALPVASRRPSAAARGRVHDLDPSARGRSVLEPPLEPVEPQLEPAAEHALRRVPGAAGGRRCRSPRARAAEPGPARSTFRPSARSSSARVPVSRSTTARVPPASSTIRSRLSPAAPRGCRSARTRRPRQRELLPGDLVARRRPFGGPAEEEAERDETLALVARSGRSSRAGRRAPRPAGRAAAAAARAATTSPSTVSSHSPRRSERSTKSRRLRIRKRPLPASTRRSPAGRGT